MPFLDWVNKAQAVSSTADVPYHLLQFESAHGDASAENLLIQGDLILDSFLGSGTTAAVAHKMSRRWIGIEMGGHAVTHCLPRLQKVIEGEQGGNVLTTKVLAHLEEQFPHTGPRVIYGETTRLGEARLREAGITFKQIPYDIKAR